MTQKERLIEILSRYFQIGDSYAYNLTRDKTAFSVGTMHLDDFEEFDEVTVADIADHLLANGVIVPPCKVGQTVYVITNKHPCYACKWCSDFCHRDCHIENKTELVVRKAKVDAVCFLDGVNEIHVEIEGTKNLHSYSGTFNFCDFGKTVFLSREEAEKALAETTDKNLQE